MIIQTNQATAVQPRFSRSGVFAILKVALNVWRQRRALESLDAAMLKDIGLEKHDVHIETQRSFWDLPSHSMR